MAKMVMIDAGQVNYLDGRGGVHQDAGDEIEVNDDVGLQLAKAGKALWSDPATDPSKGRYLLPAHIREALEAAQAGADAAEKAKAEAEAAAKARADAEAAAKSAAGQK